MDRRRQLLAAIQNDMPQCRCGKWQTYVGAYDRDGYTIRCHGCLRAMWRCTC